MICLDSLKCAIVNDELPLFCLQKEFEFIGDVGEKQMFYKITLYNPDYNNYIQIEYNTIDNFDNPYDIFTKFMTDCSVDEFGYIVDSMYGNSNSIILMYFYEDKLYTKIFHFDDEETPIKINYTNDIIETKKILKSKLLLDAKNIKNKDIVAFIGTMGIDWDKVKYNHAEIYNSQINRITMEV